MLAIFFPFQKNSFFVLSLFFCHTVPRTNVDFWKGNYVLCSRFFSFLESEIKYFQGSFIVVVVVTKDRWSRTEIESESHPPERPFVVDTDVVYGVIQTRHAFIVPFVEVRIPTPNRRINTCPACSMIVFFMNFLSNLSSHESSRLRVLSMSPRSFEGSSQNAHILTPADGVYMTRRRAAGMWAKRTQSVGNLNSSRTFIFGDFLFRKLGQKIQCAAVHCAAVLAFENRKRLPFSFIKFS